MKTVTINAIVICTIVLLLGFGSYSSQPEASVPTKTDTIGLSTFGKATAPVTLAHSLSATPAVGQPLQLSLMLTVSRYDAMRLEISSDAALATLARSSRIVRSGDNVVVDLLPQSEGRFYVNVIAHVGDGKNAQSRVFSIPVQVGKGSYKSTKQKATVSPNGERLIRMQAQEKTKD